MKSFLDRLHPGVAYTLARFGVLVVSVAVLYAVGFRSLLLVIGALLLSGVLSFFLLRNLREAFALRMEARVARRQEEKARLRSVLAGDDDPTTP